MGAILVTGASGFLGGTLCRALAAAGADVVGTGRDRDKLDGLGVRTIAADLAVSDQLPDVGALSAVVHCAALSSPWGSPAAFEAANVTATRHALHIARAQGAARFVHISTPTVYFQFRDQDDVSETQVLPKPVNAYARTKAIAETLVLKADDIDTIILRPRGIYGKGDNALLPRLLRVAKTRALPVFRDGAGATDVTHVDDVVRAIMTALDAPAACLGQIFNVSGGVAVPLPQIITAACAHVGLTPRWRRLPFRPVLGAVRGLEAVASVLPGRPEPPVTAYGLGILRYRQTLDLSKSAQLLKWVPEVSFEGGLRRTFVL